MPADWLFLWTGHGCMSVATTCTEYTLTHSKPNPVWKVHYLQCGRCGLISRRAVLTLSVLEHNETVESSWLHDNQKLWAYIILAHNTTVLSLNDYSHSHTQSRFLTYATIPFLVDSIVVCTRKNCWYVESLMFKLPKRVQRVTCVPLCRLIFLHIEFEVADIRWLKALYHQHLQ